MILEIKNISISLEQNQEKALIKHVEKLGIKKELINNLSLTKKSIDSRSRRDIKLIYNIELDEGLSTTKLETIPTLLYN